MIKQVAAALALTSLVAGTAAVNTASAAPRAKVMTESVMLGSVGHSGVTGTAFLTYSSLTQSTTVKLTLRHFKAGSVHPAHIHVGHCGGNGAVVYPFSPIVAGNNGIGVTTATFKAKLVGMLSKGYYINVHKGPGLLGKQFTVLACGNVGSMM